MTSFNMVAKLASEFSESAFIPEEIFFQSSAIRSAQTALGADISHGENLFTESEVDPRVIQFGFNSGTSGRCFNYLKFTDITNARTDIEVWHQCVKWQVIDEWAVSALSLTGWPRTQSGMSLQLSGFTCVQAIGHTGSADTEIRTSIVLHSNLQSGHQDHGSDGTLIPRAHSNHFEDERLTHRRLIPHTVVKALSDLKEVTFRHEFPQQRHTHSQALHMGAGAH